MAMTEAFSGTVNVTGTEQSMPGADQSVTGVYQLFLDPAAAATSFQAVVRIKETVKSGGTQRVVMSQVVFGGGGAVVFPSLMLFRNWNMTIQLLQGAAANVDFSIRKVG